MCHQLIRHLCTRRSPQGRAQGREKVDEAGCQQYFSSNRWLRAAAVTAHPPPCLGCIWCVPVDNTGVISLSSSSSLCSPKTETLNTTSRYTEGWGSWSKQETQGDEKQIGLWCGDWGRTQILLAPHLPCKSAQPHSQHRQQSPRLFSSFQNLQQYHKCWFFSIQLHHLDDIYESLWVSIKSHVFCKISKSAHDLKFVMKSYGLELIFFF